MYKTKFLISLHIAEASYSIYSIQTDIQLGYTSNTSYQVLLKVHTLEIISLYFNTQIQVKRTLSENDNQCTINLNKPNNRQSVLIGYTFENNMQATHSFIPPCILSLFIRLIEAYNSFKINARI